MSPPGVAGVPGDTSPRPRLISLVSPRGLVSPPDFPGVPGDTGRGSPAGFPGVSGDTGRGSPPVPAAAPTADIGLRRRRPLDGPGLCPQSDRPLSGRRPPPMADRHCSSGLLRCGGIAGDLVADHSMSLVCHSMTGTEALAGTEGWGRRHGAARRRRTGAVPAECDRPGVFGITSNTLVQSNQSSSGPAGGASNGYGLGRGAAGPDRRGTTTAAGALRVIV